MAKDQILRRSSVGRAGKRLNVDEFGGAWREYRERRFEWMIEELEGVGAMWEAIGGQLRCCCEER
jgi:hypothetical protein